MPKFSIIVTATYFVIGKDVTDAIDQVYEAARGNKKFSDILGTGEVASLIPINGHHRTIQDD